MLRKTALVTGGARRVGAAIVRSFAARGYNVVLHHGNSPEEANALAAELEAVHQVRVVVVQEDLVDSSAPARVVQAAISAFDALDVVVSSASVMEWRDFESVTPDDWARTEAINLRAPFFLMQAAARAMNEGGVIIQIGDHLANETGFPRLIPHQVTKSALHQLVRAVADRLAPRIRVNAVSPGLVLAPSDLGDAAVAAFMRDVPLARSGSPDDVIQAIHYLVDATYVTGTVLSVDGGRHLRR
ncbi:SDR family oxidoreductase [Gemmatimonas sp.]|jgi:pteridine reductase|uniref:SDR family oxidoreductase n=1 Tax=Gemmatimonas sp. TaxID=1962908 RepID=UPI0031CAB566|nr:SDR family oxidoreductase [Gemmatimonas sp.]